MADILNGLTGRWVPSGIGYNPTITNYKYCPHCGKSNTNNNNYCPYDGTSLIKAHSFPTYINLPFNGFNLHK